MAGPVGGWRRPDRGVGGGPQALGQQRSPARRPCTRPGLPLPCPEPSRPLEPPRPALP